MRIYLQKSIIRDKIMRNTLCQLILAILFTGVSFAEKTNAQAVLNRRVSISVDDATLSAALTRLEEDARVKFMYSKELINIEQKVSIQASGEKLRLVLDKLFKVKGISYEAMNNTIVLTNNLSAADPALAINKFADLQETGAVQLNVKGRVTDSRGNPLVGVSVKVKGSTMGVTTGLQGDYSLNVEGSATLVFSYVGFATREVSVNNRTIVDVVLEQDANSLEEVVVIGYGTVKKSSVTAAISKVENVKLDQMPAGRAETALVGRMPGVNITTARARPGEAPVIRIRGAASLSASNDPLIVIDGFPGGSFDNVNMNDVESIEVLKDASSAAIYGSRGSGGVIIITTKKGKTGKPQLNFNSYTGIASPRGHKDWISGQEYYDYVVRYQNREFVWAGGDPSIPVWGDVRRPAAYQVNPVIKEGNVNWEDEVLQNAPIQNYNLSVAGGTENARYYVSGTYRDEQGTFKNTMYKSYAVRANVDLKINSVLSTGFMLSPNYNRRRVLGQGVEGFVKYPPFVAVRNPDGTYPKARDYWGVVVTGGLNPMAVLEANQNYVDALNNIGEIYLGIDILKGLKFRSSVGGNLTYSIADSYTASFGNAANTPSGAAADTRRINLINENVLSYNKTFNEVHSFSAIAGASFQKETSRFTNLGIVGGTYSTDVIQTLNDAIINPSSTRTFKTSWGLTSYFGRLNYDFKEKYLLAASVRTDGSSRFAPNRKWGLFPSASVAWRLSEEAFLKDSKYINNLKIRASYGETGNFNIPDFAFLGRIGDALYAPGGVLTKGRAQINFENKDLGWEENKSYDLGVELGLFNSRVNLVADYYSKNTTDLLFEEPIPATTGFTTSLRNTGKVNNRGIELELGTRNLTGAFKWNTAFNYTRNRNKVVSLGIVNERINPDTFGMSWILRVGEPAFSYYGFKAIGVLQDANDVASSAVLAGSLPGNTKYEDVNKDGVINSADRVILGNFQPKYYMGMINDFSWKNFDLSLTMQASLGATLYNFENEYYQGALAGAMRRSLVETQWWSPAEPGDGRMPGAALSKLTWQSNSDIYLEDASFLSVRNVNFGYTLPKSLAAKLGMKNCRVYTSLGNLITVTRKGFHGYNPEGYSQGEITGLNSKPGYNTGSDPISRTYTLGLNVNF